MTTVKTLGAGDYLELLANDHWEWAARPAKHDAACIIATDGSGAIVLVEQYRHPLSARAIELPAGLVGDEAGMEDEGILSAAARELEEETGFVSSDLRFVMRAASSAGLTSEMPAFVRARNCTKIGEGGGVDDEDIMTHLIALKGAEDWLKAQEARGLKIDIKVYFGIALARGSIDR